MNVVEQQSVTLILCQTDTTVNHCYLNARIAWHVAINSLLCQVKKLQFVKKEYVIMTVVQISYLSFLIFCQLSTCHLSRKIELRKVR